MKTKFINDVVEEKPEKTSKEKDKSNNGKPAVIRRNLEEYMEQKALERRLRDVFDDYDYNLD